MKNKNMIHKLSLLLSFVLLMSVLCPVKALAEENKEK